jgi:hypothetical protein
MVVAQEYYYIELAVTGSRKFYDNDEFKFKITAASQLKSLGISFFGPRFDMKISGLSHG